MNIYFIIILFLLIGEYLLGLLVESLNLKAASPILPAEFKGFYDSDKYRKSQDYLQDNTKFKLVKITSFLLISLAFILTGGFNFVDHFARGFSLGPIPTGLIFAGTLTLAVQLLNIPFSAYCTFVIEEKYGFNRTSWGTFILDRLKSWFLIALIGGIVFSGILWFFAWAGNLAWLYCWGALTLFQIFLLFIAPAVILPMFNRFVPLEQGELRKQIEQYASGEKFKLRGIFKIDGSRRSTKASAYFTGFGRYKRIALFDTLIARLNCEELVSVLAHEVAHFKKRHLIKQMLLSIAAMAMMFFILSLFINNPYLFAAFKMEQLSIYASLFFFAFLYAPINMIFEVLLNLLSRRNEYQADACAVSTYKKPQAFINALKKLTVDNLSNLTPHPLKVFLDYSHPPALQRIQVIRDVLGRLR